MIFTTFRTVLPVLRVELSSIAEQDEDEDEEEEEQEQVEVGFLKSDIRHFSLKKFNIYLLKS